MAERLGKHYEGAPSTEELAGRADQRRRDDAARAEQRQARRGRVVRTVKTGATIGALAIGAKAADRVLENPTPAPDMSGVMRNIELKKSADRAESASSAGETRVVIDGQEHTLYVAPEKGEAATSDQASS